MVFNLISNIAEPYGLSRDCKILARLLREWHHKVYSFDFRVPVNREADVNLFVETLVPEDLRWAHLNWLMPNWDWFSPQYQSWLDRIDLILVKTQPALAALRAHLDGAADKCLFTGFTSEDMMDAAVPRERRFLHVAGKNIRKGTEAVINAWTQHGIQYPLTVVSKHCHMRGYPHIRTVEWMERDELKREMNACRFHVCPSECEGFGHTIMEAMSCGAVVLTTRAAPFGEDEPTGAWFIRGVPLERQSLAERWGVDGATLAEVVESAALDFVRPAARLYYEKQRREFEQRFRAVVEAAYTT